MLNNFLGDEPSGEETSSGSLESFFEDDSAPREPASYADLPNSERLTKSERWLYGKLPGFAESSIGKALDKFGGSWMGKALSFLDVPAEGVERTFGLLKQLDQVRPGGQRAVEDFDLAAAWYAGGLAADMTNLPTIRRDQDGNIIGVGIPTDLPGTEGLARARREIADLMKAGIEPGEALKMVREGYYNDLGALALRAQLFDTYFHVAADPLNYIMPALKPLERIQAIRTLALAGKIPVDELADMERIARAAGNIADADRIATTISKVATGELKGLTTVDKFAMFVTGGNPLEPNALSKGLVGKVNPFNLKPEARAQELVTMLTDHVGSYILSSHWDDPEGAVNAISRAAKASLGPEFGHAFLSIEGRTAQGYMGGVAAQAQDLLGQFKLVEEERSILGLVSNALGETPGKVLTRLADEPGVVLQQLSSKSSPELMAMAEAGQLTAEELGRVGKTLKTLPYDSNSFMQELMIKTEDFGMQQAILQFGVQARGLMSRWSGAVKSAETLAFLRLNPGYAVRNLINNEVTMVSRGVWNAMSPTQITDFWATQGWRPRRLAQGFGLAGETVNAESKAAKAMEAALRGGDFKAADRVKDFFDNVNLGKADVSTLARAMEESASQRAFTSGYIQGIREHFWKPGKGFDRISDNLSPSEIDELRLIDPDLPETIERAIRNSGAVEHKLDDALKTNARVNYASAVDEAQTRLPFQIEDVLDAEMTEVIASGLPDAVKNGTVDKFFMDIRKKFDDHLDNMIEKNIAELPGLIEQQVKAGGPQAFYKQFGNVVDEYWTGEVEHAIRMPTVTEAAVAAQREGNFERAGAIWDKILHDSDKFFTRRDKRLTAVLEGLERGAKSAKIGMPVEVRSNFKKITGEWRNFFKARNDGYKAIKGLKGEEFSQAINKLRNELDAKYDEMIELERRLTFEVDESVAQMIDDPNLQGAFRNWRNTMSDMRQNDKSITRELTRRVRELPPETRKKAYEEFWTERQTRIEQMWRADRTGNQMMNGDPNAAQFFSAQPTQTTEGLEGANLVRRIGSDFGISTDRSDRHLLNAINKNSGQKFKSLDEVPEDVARQALEARKVEKGGASQTFIGDLDKLFPEQMPIEMGLNNLAYSRGFASLDAIEDAVRNGAQKSPVFLDQLQAGAKKSVEKYMSKVRGQMGDARFAATRFAEFRRDSALLNYQRRNNFDSWVSNGMPFAFWTTGSIAKWAMHSIDRPAMLTTFLRTRKFMETAGNPNQGFPSRLKGSIKVKLPFAPDWMGDQFIDPLKMALPFDTFAMPYEQFQKKRFTTEGRTERHLSDMLNNGEITQQDYEDAMTHDGPLWDRAISQVQLDDEDLKFDAWDFATLMSSPHAPIMWGYNLAQGTPENIGPFTPMSRTLRNVGTTLGIKDWNNSPLNVEAKVRKAMGLPAYDRWDDYRVQRTVSNMAADGSMSVDSAKQIMVLVDDLTAGKVTRDQAMQSPVWDQYQEAVSKANQEYSGGAAGTLLGVLGIPLKSYPEGEKQQRALQEQFSKAYESYESGDVQALTDFFDDHPEYETRLALWDKPEERLSSFLNDQMWGLYNELPDVHKRDLREQLGDEFGDIFLAGQGKNLPPEKMQIWLKLAGADPVGTLSSDAKLISEFFDKVQYSDPEMAWRTQSFYNTRRDYYPDWYEQQNEYYNLPEGQARKDYLRSNTDYKEYRDWRWDFMKKNPDTVPYLTDDEYTLAKFAKRERNPEVAIPTAREFAAQLSPPMQSLIEETMQGLPLPQPALQQLEILGQQYNLSGEEVFEIIAGGAR
jgi:hypothetical protein